MHESCQPRPPPPITNAISLSVSLGSPYLTLPCDRMGGGSGVQTEPVTQLWPQQLFPLHCFPAATVPADHILLIGLH